MKALSLAKPVLIMIIGLPGAGKSYFANKFSDTFGAPLVSADRLQFELFDPPKYTPRQYGLVARLASQQLTELAKTHSSIVIDGLCNTRKERAALEKLATSHKYNVLIVWVQTDEFTAKNRSLSRSAKRDGDAKNASLTEAQFTALAGRLNEPFKFEDYVVISGKHTYATQAKTILRKLAAPRIEQAHEAHQKEADKARSRISSMARPPKRSVVIR